MIHWNIDPEIFSIGPFTVRWYGFLFAFSFVAGYQIMLRFFKKENKPLDDLNDLIWYMMIGTVIGARLGHVLFYNPGYYFSNPLEIFMVWHGGLASHGAAIGILIALWMYSKKKTGQSYLWVLDRVVVTVALAAVFIRTGNLFNSEIVGTPTDVPWAFVFERIGNTPRHPAQLYEAIAYLLIFFLLMYIYNKKNGKPRKGYIFGMFLVTVFTSRFFIEFVKARQAEFENDWSLRVGQILSIPLIIAGFYFLYYYKGSDTEVSEKKRNPKKN